MSDTYERIKELSGDIEVASGNTVELLNALDFSVVIVDQRGVIMTLNKRAELFLGYHSSELLGKSVETLVPVRFRAQHVQHRAKYAEEPRPRTMGNGRLICLCKDGSEKNVNISLGPMVIPSGQFTVVTIRPDNSSRGEVVDEVRADRLPPEE